MGFILWTTASCLLLGFMGMSWLTDAQRGGVLFAAALAGMAAAISAGREANTLRRWSRWKLWRGQQQHDDQIGHHARTHHENKATHERLDSLTEIVRRPDESAKGRAAEILDVKLKYSSRHGMFDLLVPVFIHDGAPFRDDWRLTLRLADGRVVPGMRGETKAHAFNSPQGKFDMTVSFSFGGQIPDLKSLTGAAVMRLSAVDSKDRLSVFEPAQELSLSLSQDEESYPVGPIIAVEITKEARWKTPNISPGLTPFFWGLKIRNEGDAADFQAWAELKTGMAPLAPPGRHRLSFQDGVKSRILEGAEDRVFFAVVYWTSIYNSVIAKALWFFDEHEKKETDSQLFPGEQEGKVTSASAVVAELEITIASEPSMVLPWKRRYRLGPGNELHDVTRSESSSEVPLLPESAS